MPDSDADGRPAGSTRVDPTSEAFLEVASSDAFIDLRGRFRRFAFPMTVFFVVWYLLYVLLSCYAEGFMSQRIGGSAITNGLVLGLLQFLSTFVITWLYIRHANKSLDPVATQLKDKLETEAQL